VHGCRSRWAQIWPKFGALTSFMPFDGFGIYRRVTNVIDGLGGAEVRVSKSQVAKQRGQWSVAAVGITPFGLLIV
jgi:hypothetical protein